MVARRQECRGWLKRVRTSRPAPLRRDAVLEAVTFAAERCCSPPTGTRRSTRCSPGSGSPPASRATVIVDGPRRRAARSVATGSGMVRARCPSMRDTRRGAGEQPVDPRVRALGRRDDARASRSSATSRPSRRTEQAESSRQGDPSLAYYPITVDGDWWGCYRVRGLRRTAGRGASPTSTASRTAAALLGAAIARQRQEERLRDAETRYRGVVERIPAVTYVDVAHARRRADGVPQPPDRVAARLRRRAVPGPIPTRGSTSCIPTIKRASTRPRGTPAPPASRSTRSTGCATPTATGSGCTTRRRRCRATTAPTRATSRGSSSTSPPARRPRPPARRPSTGTGRWSRRSRPSPTSTSRSRAMTSTRRCRS